MDVDRRPQHDVHPAPYRLVTEQLTDPAGQFDIPGRGDRSTARRTQGHVAFVNGHATHAVRPVGELEPLEPQLRNGVGPPQTHADHQIGLPLERERPDQLPHPSDPDP